MPHQPHTLGGRSALLPGVLPFSVCVVVVFLRQGVGVVQPDPRLSDSVLVSRVLGL